MADKLRDGNLPYDILSPDKTPFGEWVASITPGALRPGEFKESTNLRVDDRSVYSRQQDTVFSSAAPTGFNPASDVVLGGETVTLNGTVYILGAFKIGSTTQICSMNTSNGAWTELTAASGQYGSTRLASTSANVTFTVVRDIDTGSMKDCVIISNGVDYPRVYDGTTFSIHQPITPPTDGSQLNRVVGTFFTSLPTDDAATPTYGNTPGGATRLVGSTQLVGADRNIRLAAGNATAVGDKCSMRFTSTYDFQSSRQLVFLYKSSYAQIWDNFKIEIAEGGSTTIETAGNGAGVVSITVQAASPLVIGDEVYFETAAVYRTLTNVAGNVITWVGGVNVAAAEVIRKIHYDTVYDHAQASLRSRVFAQVDDAAIYFQVGFGLDHIDTASRNTVQYMRFTWTGASRGGLGSTYSLDLYVIAGSGGVPGGAQYGLAYYNSASRGESYGMVIPNKAQAKVSDLNGADLAGLTIVENDLFFYQYDLYFQNTSTAQRDLGVDRLRLYRKDTGETKFAKLATAVTLASWGGASWSFTSGTALSIRTSSDSAFGTTKDPTIEIPDGYHLVIPIASATINVGNNRLLCGDCTIDASRARGDYYFSHDTVPFRCRRFAKFLADGTVDPASPSRVALAGEQIMAFARVPTTFLGIDTVFIFTKDNTHTVDSSSCLSLSRPQLRGPHGTLAPRSVKVYEDKVFSVDKHRQIRVYSAATLQSEAVSRDRCESVLLAAKDISTCETEVWKDLLRVAYCPAGASGTNNTRVILYDFRRNKFIGEDTITVSGLTYDYMILANISNALVMFVIAADGKAYKLENTAASSGMSCTLTTWDIHREYWDYFAVERIGVLCDDMTGTMATTRTFKPTGSATGSANLDGANAYTHRWDDNSGAIPGEAGIACQVSFVFTMPSGKRIYALKAEITDRTGPGPDTGAA